MSQLPRDWAWATLGDVAEIVSGSTPRTTEPSYWNGDIAWITPDDLSKHRAKLISRGARLITRSGYESCSARLVPAGTVLYTSRAPIGYVAIAANPVCTNQGFKSFVPTQALTSDYLYWFLRYATPEIRKLGSGTTFPELSKTRAREIPIPIPPLAEQSRIVGAIEEQLSRLEAATSSSGLALMRAGLLRVAVLENVFNQPWPEERVGEVASLADGPFGSNLKTAHYVDVGPRVVRLQNIGEGFFRDERAHITWAHFRGLLKHSVEPGDIVAASLGDDAPRACLVPDSLGPAIVKADCIRIRPSKRVMPAYLMWALNSRPLRRQAAARIKGIGRPRLGLAGLRELRIPLPSIDAQRTACNEIEHALASLQALEARIGTARERSTALRRAILARAFRGELVPHDPDDEPAGVLLARIAVECATTAGRSTRQHKEKTPA